MSDVGMKQVADNREHYAGLASGRPNIGVDWLDAARARGIAGWRSRGFPARQDEAWKYTRVKELANSRFGEAGDAELTAEQIAALSFDDITLVCVDGQYSEALSALAGLPDGAKLTGLGLVMQQRPTCVQEYLSTDFGEQQPFALLNQANLNDGFALRVADGVNVEQPVTLLSISTQANTATHPRHVIELGANAKLTVTERQIGLSADTHTGEYFVNRVTQIKLAEGASLTHNVVQQESSTATAIELVDVQQAGESHYLRRQYDLGGKLIRHDVNVALGAAEASCSLQGLYLVSGMQHVDNHTLIDHQAPDCVSKEFYKGVLDDSARAVFNGEVRVARDAQRTDSDQQNRNLLLSRDAEVDTKPALEIYADDVKCAHGATVGELDEAALFYLRSRGIPEGKARSTLTYAFAGEILRQLPAGPVRDVVDDAVHQVLES